MKKKCGISLRLCAPTVVNFSKLMSISKCWQPRLLAGLSGVLLSNLFELTVDDDHQFRVSVKRDDD